MARDVDSSAAVTGSSKLTATVKKALAKTATWVRPALPLPYNAINSVAISKDGQRVVAGTFFYNDGSATTPIQTVGFIKWDGAGNQLWSDTFAVTANPSHRAGILSVSLARDGAWAASGGGTSPGAGFVDVYDATGNKNRLATPPETVRSVELSHDGKFLVAGADQLYVFKRSGSTWSGPTTLSDPSGVVQRVGISGDGQWIATAINGGWTSLVRNLLGSGGGLTKVGAWQIPTTPGQPQMFVQEVAVAADGSAYAAAGADGTAYYFDIAAAPPLTPLWGENPSGPTACRWVSISDDGSQVAAVFTQGVGAGVGTKGKVFLLQNLPGATPPYKTVWTGKHLTAHGPNAVSMGEQSSTQTYVATADGIPNPSKPDGGFNLFDGIDGTNLWDAPPDHNYATKLMNYAVAVSADGSAVAGGSNDGKVYYFTPVP